MNFSFASLIRLIVLVAILTTMMAVGLSRLDPPRPELRIRQVAGFANINEFLLDVNDRVPRWLDADSGRVDACILADGDILEAASCSPWADEKGRSQVVGRWTSRTQDGPNSISRDFGIARYSFPDGAMIDQVPTEIVPVGPPCWMPGTRARVLFAAGDGQLYHYAFESGSLLRDIEHDTKRDASPQKVTWRCPKPGSSETIFVNDVSWPEDSRMGGRIIVSLREQEAHPDGHTSFTRTKLWWLKLNITGDEIVEAGQLLDQDESNRATRSMDLRSPIIATLADGRLILAYLSQSDDRSGWELRVTPIESRGERRVPIAFESGSQLLSRKCQPSHPCFSRDGRWLNAIINPDSDGNRVARFATGHFCRP